MLSRIEGVLYNVQTHLMHHNIYILLYSSSHVNDHEKPDCLGLALEQIEAVCAFTDEACTDEACTQGTNDVEAVAIPCPRARRTPGR